MVYKCVFLLLFKQLCPMPPYSPGFKVHTHATTACMSEDKSPLPSSTKGVGCRSCSPFSLHWGPPGFSFLSPVYFPSLFHYSLPSSPSTSTSVLFFYELNFFFSFFLHPAPMAVSLPSSLLLTSPTSLLTPPFTPSLSSFRKKASHASQQSKTHQVEVGPSSSPYFKAGLGNKAWGTVS